MKKNYSIFHNKDRYRDPILFHSHDFYEFYFFFSGNVTYYVEDEEYDLKKGDVLIIPPGKMHRPVIEKREIYERYVLWINKSFLSENKGVREYVKQIHELTDEKNTHCITFDPEGQRWIRSMMDEAFCQYASSEELSGVAAESSIILILNRIRDELRSMERVRNKGGGRIHQVIAYLNEHYVKNPTLDELADHFYVSKYYLAHEFKEYTKTTIHRYILEKKINLARTLLQSGERPQEVYVSCGFSTYSNFYKAFVERMGVPPGRYSI